MPLDAQGIYQYDDSETYSPLNDYQNLGMESVSATVADIRSDISSLELLVDSDWVLIETFGEGWIPTPGHPPRVRKVGDRVDIFGAVTFDGGGTASNILTMPTGYIPAGEYTQQFLGTGTTSRGNGYTFYVSSVNPGVLRIPTGYAQASFIAPEVAPLLGSWYVS